MASNKIVVPIPFRAGEREVTREQVVQRLVEVRAVKWMIDIKFEQFKRRYYL